MVGPRSGLKTTLLCPLALVGTDHHEAFFSASARSGLKTTLLFDSFAPSPHGRRPLRSLFPLRNSRCGAAATSASSPRAKKKGEHGPGEGQRNAKDHEAAKHVGGVDLLPVHYGSYLSHTHIHAHVQKGRETRAHARSRAHHETAPAGAWHSHSRSCALSRLPPCSAPAGDKAANGKRIVAVSSKPCANDRTRTTRPPCSYIRFHNLGCSYIRVHDFKASRQDANHKASLPLCSRGCAADSSARASVMHACACMHTFGSRTWDFWPSGFAHIPRTRERERASERARERVMGAPQLHRQMPRCRWWQAGRRRRRFEPRSSP